ncbi:diflavin oxidoreductase [Blattabacterium cuenoti]|uniref:diflavin oxidoreductase n=1 Tax=Blattabacterium cuenoti TaxID=1653831 RepID=UPI001CC220E2|nr:flavodoxin domain-containing protein [Blattabacterium cuenoti]
MNILSESKKKTFIHLIETSTKEEIAWMNGYISGYLLDKRKNNEFSIHENNHITLVYGSESGNAKKLSLEIYHRFIKEKLNIRLFNLSDYYLNDLEKEKYLLIVISTYGYGDAPKSAKGFYNFIHENKRFFLKNLQYSVLALGDRSHSFFCKAGEDIDKRLNDVGASRIIPLQKCDADYKESSYQWLSNILDFFVKKKKKKNITKILGKISNKIPLSDINKTFQKEVYHIEILMPYYVNYCPGDSIGIFPENDTNKVNRIINFFLEKKWIKFHQKDDFFKILKKEKSVDFLSENFLSNYSLFLKKKQEIINDKKWNLLDIMKNYPIDYEQFSCYDMLKIMDPIKPRLYSISSSPRVHGNEIHIAVSIHYFYSNRQRIYGTCSNFLSKIKKNDSLKFFICKNQLFKLPKKNENIILIAAGTGIAPFRSFLYERESLNVLGKSWLFFGDQYSDKDFSLYQKEIKIWVNKNILYKANFSFSRDQKKKIYVQHQIWENRIEFFSWMKSGAYIFICGKKVPMSIDVENTIKNIIYQVGNIDATKFMNDMKKEKRYLKDVY